MTTAAPRRTQEERRAEAERKLVQAAAEIISEGGLGSLTLANVGRRAGYSRGLATHRFGSKAGLIEQVTEAVIRQFTDAITESDDSGSAVDDLVMFVRTYVDRIEHPETINSALLMIISDAVANPSSDARDSVVQFEATVLAYVTDLFGCAVGAGELDESTDPATWAAMITGALRGVSVAAALNQTVDVAAVGDELERLIRARAV